MSTKAENPKIDFAFPKTVSEYAEKDLKKAQEDNDVKGVLNAFIRYYISKKLIDRASVPNSIDMAQTLSDKYQDNKLHGLFDLLLADMYYTYYSSERWKFNSRELPLEPYPTDISEWSGEQFRAKIKSLCMSVLDGTDAKDLARCQLSDYSDIITFDDISLIYFPTLLDFAKAKVYSLTQGIIDYNDREAELSSLTDRFISESKPESAQFIYWTSNKIRNVKDFYGLLKKEISNPYTGYIFTLYGQYSYDPIFDEYGDYDEETEETSNDAIKARIYNLSNRYLQDFPNTPFKNSIRDCIDRISQPVIQYNFSNYCGVGSTVEVKIKYSNTPSLTVSTYSLLDKDPNQRLLDVKHVKNNRKCLSQKIIDTKGVLPFEGDTSVTFAFDEPGYYAIIVESKGIETKKRVDYVRCIPAMPIALSNINTPLVAAVDPVDGKPLQRVSVTLKSYDNIEKINCTDAQGLALFPNQESTKSIALNYKGKDYPFEDIGLSKLNINDDTSYQYSTSVLTDRALYHPGEKLQVAVVVSRYCTVDGELQKSLYSNKKIIVKLCDPNYQEVSSIEVTTDDFGRSSTEFDLPTEGLTGFYNIEVTSSEKGHIGSIGSGRVMISDFKLSDFELLDCLAENDTPSKGDVTITGKVQTFSGMPLANTKIKVSVSECSFWRMTNSHVFMYREATSDDNGNFTMVLDREDLEDEGRFFVAHIDAESPSGTTATAEVYFHIGKKYKIDLSVPSKVNIQSPFSPSVKVYSADGKIVEFPLKWKITAREDTTTIISGEYGHPIVIKGLKPGVYRFYISTVDETLADSEFSTFELYDTSTDIIPTTDMIWCLESHIDVNDDEATEILYGTYKDNTWVYTMIFDDRGNILSKEVTDIKKGYHTLNVNIPEACKDGIRVLMFTVDNCKVYEHTVVVKRKKKDTSLKIIGESFRNNLLPGSQETWNIKVVSNDSSKVKSAVVLDMYNKAIESLSRHNLSLSFQNYGSQFWQYSLNHIYLHNVYGSIEKKLNYRNVRFITPYFNLYSEKINDYGGIRIRGLNMIVQEDASEPMMMSKSMAQDMAEVRVTGYGSVKYSDENESMVLDDDADGYVEVNSLTMNDNIEQTGGEDIDYREQYVPLAIWAPMLSTDNDGDLTYTFTVPNANTTWRLQALAWTQDMRQGRLVREFVASKPVMVTPNMPRFLRAGDKATVVAMVMNNSDENKTITTTVELFDPLTSQIISSTTNTHTLEPKMTANVDIDIIVPIDAQAIGYRVRSKADGFSDGEQSVIRILSNDAVLVETTPFYLNPGESEFNMVLPKHNDARLSLTFCENPVWSIVSALPGLRTQIDNYANSAAAALFSAAIAQGIVKSNPEIGKAIMTWKDNPSDSALVSMLERNEDLKIAILNATPWVQAAQSQNERMANLSMILDDKETNAAIKQALDILKDLQQSDGGWKWGKWCDESSVWITSNVLSMLSDLKMIGWMPDDTRLHDMIVQAVSYYDKKVKNTDIVYSIIRPRFTDITISSNGRNVINATLAEIKKEWKNYTDPAYKAMAAEALYMNNDKTGAAELMRSISEFGVMTEHQGLKFPSVNSLCDYSILLEAYALICPESKEVDGLRQQLIVRKQGGDWGDAVITTQVVRAILCGGSKWTVDAEGATIKVGKKVIEPSSPIETATGWLRADLSSLGGKELTITTTGNGPSYGAVYAQFTQLMTDVKASSCDDLDIEKTMYVRRGSEWEVSNDLKVGDRVKVQLTIHCKRNLQYVGIIDDRAACFEPVDQLPGWIWSEGAAFYKENRDSRTQLHIVFMRPGTYLLTYEVNVNTAGVYSSGVATIQSQYAPELSAHSSGTLISIE